MVSGWGIFGNFTYDKVAADKFIEKNTVSSLRLRKVKVPIVPIEKGKCSITRVDKEIQLCVGGNKGWYLF